MFKRSLVLIFSLFLLLTLFTSAVFAGELQTTLLNKLQQPGQSLTRAEFVSMLVQAAELPAPTWPVSLPLDVPAGAWYANDMKTALVAGVISRTPKNTISPDLPLTQAQAAVMLSRVLGLPGVESPGPLPSPVPNSHWAFVPFTWLVKEGIVDPTVKPNAFLTPAEGAALLDKVFGTAKEAKEIMEKSQATQAVIKTMRGTSDMSMSMKANPAVLVQGLPAYIGMKAKVNYEMNLDQGLHQQFTMTMAGLPQTIPPMEVEQYMVAEGMFMKIKDPMTSKVTWIKMPEGSVPNFMELMKQQPKFMQLPREFDKYFHYRLLGEKKVGEKTFFELSFFGDIPNLAQFMNMVGAQSGLNQQMIKSFEQSGSMIRGINIVGKILINKENLYAEQLNATAVIVFADKFEGKPFPLKSLTANFNFLYKDYGTKIDIQLPAEAAKTQGLPMTQPGTTPVKTN